MAIPRPSAAANVAAIRQDSAATAQTRFIQASGIQFAYRTLGPQQGFPMLLLQHFTGTLDSWDPAVVDGLATSRRVILLDNAGVGASGGVTPDSVEEMAAHAIAFVKALGLERVDVLGFSLGGYVAQALTSGQPDLVRRLILAGTGPEGGVGIKNLGEVLARAQAVGAADPRLPLFFDATESSQRAGRAFLERQSRRTSDRDPEASEASTAAQFAAIVRWGAPTGAEVARQLPLITHPVLVVNGKSDVMVPSINSFVLFRELPDARLILYPDSGHGALFQYPTDFVRDALRFLDH